MEPFIDLFNKMRGHKVCDNLLSNIPAVSVVKAADKGGANCILNHKDKGILKKLKVNCWIQFIMKG